MTFTIRLVCLASFVSLAACGGHSNPDPTPGDCAVTITGAPHSGTFETCGIVMNAGGDYVITMGGLPDCSDCVAGAIFTDPNGTTAGYTLQVTLDDPTYQAMGGADEVVTEAAGCNESTHECLGSGMIASSTITTHSWSGTITATVAVTATGPSGIRSITTADITLDGSFTNP